MPMKTPVAIETSDMYVEMSTTRPCCGVRGVGLLVGASAGMRGWAQPAEVPDRTAGPRARVPGSRGY